jgi:hypothetical protein
MMLNWKLGLKDPYWPRKIWFVFRDKVLKAQQSDVKMEKSEE